MKTLFRLFLLVSVLVSLLGLGGQPAQASHLGGARGLVLDNSRQLAFYAIGGGGVVILDISNPANITLVSDAIQEQGTVEDLFYDAATQRLYIAADEGDLAIWDIQNPAAPQQISVTPLYYFGTEVPARSVEVSGNHAYVSTDYGYLHWVDVSNPAAPVDQGFNGVGGSPSRKVHIGDNGQVYLAGPKITRFNINANGSLSSAGQNYYANSYQVFAGGGYVYISSGVNTFDILDGSIATMPFLSSTSLPNVSDIFAVGNYAYIANGGAGLRIFDVTDRTNPQEVALEASDGATSVVVEGNYAYVSVATRFRILDVSTPSAPSVVGTYDANGTVNVPPVANAGFAQAVPSRARVTLNGSYSYDPDGTIVGYSWRQLTGPKVRLRRAKTAMPRFRAPRVRSYPVVQLIFELTVTDNNGATSTSQTQVNVFP